VNLIHFSAGEIRSRTYQELDEWRK